MEIQRLVFEIQRVKLELRRFIFEFQRVKFAIKVWNSKSETSKSKNFNDLYFFRFIQRTISQIFQLKKS